jgi:hypothetical protein
MNAGSFIHICWSTNCWPYTKLPCFINGQEKVMDGKRNWGWENCFLETGRIGGKRGIFADYYRCRTATAAASTIGTMAVYLPPGQGGTAD